MGRTASRLAVATVAAGILSACGGGSGSADRRDQSAAPAASGRSAVMSEQNDVAPDFFAVTPVGDTLRLGNGNTLTLLNLWATWCGPCRDEFPDLERIHQRFSPSELRVLAVDVDPDPPDVVQAFADELGVTFLVASDPTGTISSRFRVLGLPSTFLINGDGVIVRRWSGVLPPTAADTLATIVAANAEKS